MALLQDQEARLKKELARRQRHGTRGTQVAMGFLLATILIAGSLVLYAIYAVYPSGTTLTNRPGDYDDRLTNQLVGVIHQGAETILPSPDVIENIRQTLRAGEFAFFATPEIKSTKTNTTIPFDIRVIRGPDFRDEVFVSAEDFPETVTVVADPERLVGSEEDSVIEMTVPSSVPVGSYTFIVKAVADDLTKTAPVTLSITNFAIENARLVAVETMEVGLKWQATIGWETEVPANTWVEYATDEHFVNNRQSYSFTSTDQENKTTHEITLAYLEPDTVYHYRLKSVDTENNIVYGADRAFVTKTAEQIAE